MNDQNIFNTIKSTVNGFLPDAEVFLFGSRARGDHNIESDFDILIITKNTFAGKEKISWTGKIRKALIKSLHLPFDVLLNSKQEIAYKKELPGHVIRWALKEGVML